MSDAPAAAADRFAREGGRNRFTARRAQVVRVQRVAPRMVRVTVSGPEFADFESAGPADHVRVFFPDPATGELVAPTPVGPGEDGIVRPDRASISRDFTPLPRTADGGVDVDLDFFVHPDPGPASAWAETARAGDELVMIGPRGSRRAPQRIDGLVLICDETSLPSASRWIRDVPSGTAVEVIAAVSDGGDWVAGYLGDVARRRGAHAGRRGGCRRRGHPRGPRSDRTDRRGDLRVGGRGGDLTRAGAPAPAAHARTPAGAGFGQRLLAEGRRGVRPSRADRPVRPRRVRVRSAAGPRG